MDFTQHYLGKAKQIPFLGEMRGAPGDVILVPHKVTQTSSGKSVRLVPCMEFPCVRLSTFQNETQFAYLKSQMMCNGQSVLPSKINEMLFFIQPFDPEVIRQELRPLQYSEETIEAFISFFPTFQEHTLGDSKLAKAGKIVLDWKHSKAAYEKKIVEQFQQKKPKYSIQSYVNASDIFQKETERMRNDSFMDMYFSEKVNEYYQPKNVKVNTDSLYNDTLDVLLN
jgi:hypothetical protein